eukprot:TRINITY_DN55436_c0_g1_i1.p1 TRINITY_DN55436_c0_g1~~TRINITY_DN55436_c0_g1_i1.p1  ORF type:complete len:318 (+),score=43.05 TRINITY_DN55436_c0_g1_i1:66-1019(+)
MDGELVAGSSVRTPACELPIDVKYYCLLRALQQPVSGYVSEAGRNKSVEDGGSAFVEQSRASNVMVYSSEAPLPERLPGTVRCVAISDTHTCHTSLHLPQGDILLHCGDFSNLGTVAECESFCDWMTPLPFQHKLLVCGNHDLACDREWYMSNWQTWHDTFQSPELVATKMQDAGLTILEDREVKVCGIRIYGNPAQPRQPKSRPQMAFGRRRGTELKEEWAKLPGSIDVLMTHAPPAGILDADPSGKQLGCEELAKAVGRLKPAIHVFGHVHNGYGTHTSKHTHFINAASARQRRGEGSQLNPPIVFDVFSRGYGD